MAITAITSVQEFDEKVLGAKGLAIVDFWAGWCEPCTVMRPEIEDVAERVDNLSVALQKFIERYTQIVDCERNAKFIGVNLSELV